MERIEEFVDERQKSWCIHCTGTLVEMETNEDHVPSKSLLRKPRPHNLPIVTICKNCNASFSLDEQYLVAFLSCVIAGTTEPESQPNDSAARALRDSSSLRSRIERARTEYVTQGGETRVVWKPEMARIERVVLKNARGHAYGLRVGVSAGKHDRRRAAPVRSSYVGPRRDRLAGGRQPDDDTSTDTGRPGQRLDRGAGRNLPLLGADDGQRCRTVGSRAG